MAAITAAVVGLALWLGRLMLPKLTEWVVALVKVDPSGDALAIAIPVVLMLIVSFVLWAAQAVLRRAWRRSGVAR